MYWDKELFDIKWSQDISNFEGKQKIAKKIASFAKDGDIIGFGSGSTSFLAVKEIAERIKKEKLHIFAIPTSKEIKTTCIALGIPTLTIEGAKPDWSFDGADEVDNNHWLIKGRGGAMFNEKLIMPNSEKTYILVDNTKFVNKLCEKFPIPIECIPDAVTYVKSKLFEMGAIEVNLRQAGKSKDGPVITENGNYILDVKFENVLEDYEKKIKSICGVLETGLFQGYDIEILSI